MSFEIVNNRLRLYQFSVIDSEFEDEVGEAIMARVRFQFEGAKGLCGINLIDETLGDFTHWRGQWF